MKYISAIIGMIIGVVLVRGFLFDSMEEIGWGMFWHEFGNGNIGSRDISNVSGSATFIKVVIGGVIGAAIGGVWAINYPQRNLLKPLQQPTLPTQKMPILCRTCPHRCHCLQALWQRLAQN